ncbi:MAG: ABC transporter permease [Longimicrobiales bacterium]
MDDIGRMFRFGLRSLGRNPAFTWTVVLLFGLGVGSVTTIFTLLDHVLLRPLPYPAADRLIELEYQQSGPTFQNVHEFGSVEAWAAARTLDANLTGAGRPQRLTKAEVSEGFLALFGARPSAGRLLVADDFRTGEAVVLSHGAWQRVFGGDAGVIGRQIVLDGKPAVVIGVLDASFEPPEAHVGTSVDVWGPLDPAAEWLSRRDNEQLRVAGRLREGRSLAAVSAEADALAQRRWREHPRQHSTPDCPPEMCPGGIRPIPVASLQEATVGTVRKGLGLLFGAVTLLLLIACTNVAQLFLARGLARAREMSVRRALGARTGSLMSQLLVESLLVSAGGMVLGVLLAHAGLHGLLALGAEALPRVDAIRIDLRVLAFALSVALATGLVFGLLPALRLARGDAADALLSRARGSTDGRRANRLRAGLVVAEVALSVILVTGAGLLLRSLARLHDQELGFRTENVWTLPLSPVGIETGEEWVRRMERVRSSLAETPGVQAATYGTTLPLEFVGGRRCCWNNRPTFSGIEFPVLLQMHPVDADYFDLLDVEIVAGAPWQRHEEDLRPIPALLSEGVAVDAFGSAEDAVGREMQLLGTEYRIVGVVRDHLYYGADQPAAPLVYLPITTSWPTRAHMAVLVNGGEASLASRLREAVWRAEPDLPVPVVRSLDEWNGAANARMRFESLLFTTFGAVALVLVAGGLYGTLLYAVGLRRRELGIRLALGDSPARLRWTVVGQGFRIAAIGCALGGVASLAFGRLLESRLFGVEANDLLTIGGVLAIVIGNAVVASWVPARRAAATDPMEALRAE